MTPLPRSAALAEPWPVVLLHGTRTSHSQWDPQVPALRAAGHAVHTPDLPGHGDRRGEPFTLETALAAIEQAVRTAHRAAGRPVHLVGSSLGGLLAIPVPPASRRSRGCWAPSSPAAPPSSPPPASAVSTAG